MITTALILTACLASLAQSATSTLSHVIDPLPTWTTTSTKHISGTGTATSHFPSPTVCSDACLADCKNSPSSLGCKSNEICSQTGGSSCCGIPIYACKPRLCSEMCIETCNQNPHQCTSDEVCTKLAHPIFNNNDNCCPINYQCQKKPKVCTELCVRNCFNSPSGAFACGASQACVLTSTKDACCPTYQCKAKTQVCNMACVSNCHNDSSKKCGLGKKCKVKQGTAKDCCPQYSCS